MTLTIEHCLSVTFAFFLYFLSKKEKKNHVYLLLTLLPITILMKENFIFLIPILVLMGIIVLKEKIFSFDFINYKNKYFYLLISPIVSAVLLYAFYQTSFDIENTSRSPLDLFFKSEKLSYIPIISLEIIKAIFTKNIIIQGDINNYFYLFKSLSFQTAWLGSAMFFMIIANLFLFIFNSHDLKNITYLFIINFGFIIYFLFLLMVYTFGMSHFEASTLSSYERYISVYVFGVMLFILITISTSEKIIVNKTRFSFLSSIAESRVFYFFIILFSIYFYNGLSSSRMFFTSNPDVNFVKLEKDTLYSLKENVENLINCKNCYQPYQEKNIKNITFALNSDRANIKSIIFRYMLAPNHMTTRKIELENLNMSDNNKKILNLSDIIVFDNLNDNQEKLLKSYFYEINIEKLNNKACWIFKNKSESKFKLDCY